MNRRTALIAAALTATFGATLGAMPARAATQPDNANPFATHKLVLQLSDGSMDKQNAIISAANSVLKDYPNTVSIVVVAFGPGVRILYANAPLREAVDSLVSQGVEFDVCMNTIDTIKRKTGHAPKLNPHAIPVPYGIPRIMDLVSKGYILVRP
jgi:intracellular sulfur oxidation DsrE/DsrF family protein